MNLYRQTIALFGIALPVVAAIAGNDFVIGESKLRDIANIKKPSVIGGQASMRFISDAINDAQVGKIDAIVSV